MCKFHLLKLPHQFAYLGTADGFTTFLRKKFTKNYAGLEIELNQKHFKNKEWIADFYRYPKLLAKII